MIVKFLSRYLHVTPFEATDHPAYVGHAGIGECQVPGIELTSAGRTLPSWPALTQTLLIKLAVGVIQDATRVGAEQHHSLSLPPHHDRRYI